MDKIGNVVGYTSFQGAWKSEGGKEETPHQGEGVFWITVNFKICKEIRGISLIYLNTKKNSST